MRGTWRFAFALIAAVAVRQDAAAAQEADARQVARAEEALRREGQAVIALADAASDEQTLPSDFTLAWHNDFLKAQSGTFIPFVVSIASPDGEAQAALLYVRAARRRDEEVDGRKGRRRTAAAADVVMHPFEEIYPVALSAKAGQSVRIARGFSLPPGEYELTVVVRERERSDRERNERGRRRLAAAVLRRGLSVPDYSTGELATSTIMLADGLTILQHPPAPSELDERPYIIGTREIQPAADAVYRRAEELIVLFLVYNPALTPEKHFDLEVEYHFFRKSREGSDAAVRSPGGPTPPAALPGERYFNRTEPQRFNPLVLGPQFAPESGHPVLAGQGVPLAGFQEGDYRLAITVTDLISRRSLERHVTFTVLP